MNSGSLDKVRIMIKEYRFYRNYKIYNEHVVYRKIPQVLIKNLFKNSSFKLIVGTTFI